MNLPSKLKFIDPKLHRAFNLLPSGNADDQQLYAGLLKAFQNIEKNAFCGTPIPTKQIPAIYMKKYHIYGLWKYDLPDSWRLWYTIENDQILVVSILLEWMDHKKT